MGLVLGGEPLGDIMQGLTGYRFGSPSGLMRLMIQQSNCFLVVERGVGMQNLMQERSLAQSGQLRQGSNMGGGQMVTADYVLTPAAVVPHDAARAIRGGRGDLPGALAAPRRLFG